MSQPNHIAAIRAVVKAISGSRIAAPLQHIRSAGRVGDTRDFLAMLLGSYRDYSLAARDFGEAERRVVAIMQLDRLGDAQFWAALSASGQPDEAALAALYQTHSRVVFALNHLPTLLMLIEDRRAAPAGGRPNATPVPAGYTVLAHVMQATHGRELVDTNQLSYALDAVGSLYQASCLLAGTEAATLAIQDWRAQPMPMFSVMVEAPVRPVLDRLLLSITEQLRAVAREQSSVLEALHRLPDLDLVDQAGSEGRLGADTAEDLRHLLVNGAANYLLSGCVPSRLPAPERPALGALVQRLEIELQAQHEASSGAVQSVDLVVDEGDHPGTLVIDQETDVYDADLDRTYLESLPQMEQGPNWPPREHPLADEPPLGGVRSREDAPPHRAAAPPRVEMVDDGAFSDALKSLIAESRR